MFRELRRKNKQISIEEIKNILKNTRYGFLALSGDDDYPYVVPINYLYDELNNKIYFHGSKVGHKADSLRRNAKVCFALTDKEKIIDETWAPYVSSVVVFGKCHIIEDEQETLKLVKAFANKYYPDQDSIDVEVKKSFRALSMFEICIEHISGKQIQEK